MVLRNTFIVTYPSYYFVMKKLSNSWKVIDSLGKKLVSFMINYTN
jgi:hypothetical protein